LEKAKKGKLESGGLPVYEVKNRKKGVKKENKETKYKIHFTL
jgi:hypothetical protein